MQFLRPQANYFIFNLLLFFLFVCSFGFLRGFLIFSNIKSQQKTNLEKCKIYFKKYTKDNKDKWSNQKLRLCYAVVWASQVALVLMNPSASAGDTRDEGLISGSGRPPGGGHGSPLLCSCPENPVDRGAWWATVHRVTKSQT